MLRLLRSGALPGSLLIVGSLLFSSVLQAQTVREYRDALIELNLLTEQLHTYIPSSNSQATVRHALQQIIQMPDEALVAMQSNAMPLNTLQAMVLMAQQQISALPGALRASEQPDINVFNSDSSPEVDTIDIPEVETAIAFCIDIPGTVVGISQGTYKILSAVVEAAKFTCLQQVAGENSATACTVLEIAAVTAEFVYREGDFCRGESRAAKGEAILQLDRNIGAFFNEAVDQTAISSRTSQDAVDQVTVSTLAADNVLIDIQNTIDTNFVTISDDLDVTLAELQDLTENLTNLIAETEDVQFRTQINQVNIQDVQTRTADLQQSGEEIRQDTQDLISVTGMLQTTADELTSAVADGFILLNRDEIARALANPDYTVPEYVTPAEHGGQLEEVREVVIQAIVLMDSISPGNTGTALTLLTQGDQAYNAENYLAAYNLFAQAYRAIGSAGSLR